MTRVLVTGFLPFGRQGINPSGGLALEVHGAVLDDVHVVSALLPVSYVRAPQALRAVAARVGASAILAMGLAADRPRVSVERRAHGAPGPRLDEDGLADAGYGVDVSALPWAEAVAAALDADLSDDAGRFVCNRVASHLATLDLPTAFVHVPAQGLEIAALHRAIRVLAGQGASAAR